MYTAKCSMAKIMVVWACSIESLNVSSNQLNFQKLSYNNIDSLI